MDSARLFRVANREPPARAGSPSLRSREAIVARLELPGDGAGREPHRPEHAGRALHHAPLSAVTALVLALSGACASGGAAARAPSPAKDGSAAASAPAPSGPPAPAVTPAQPARRELSPRAQRLCDEAVAAAGAGKRMKVPEDWETLERRWRAVLDAEPVPEAWFNLGVVLEKRGKPGDARAAYAKALALEPGLSQAAVNLAILDEPKDPQAAAQAWSELSRRFPDDPVPRERLASLYLGAGQRDEAWRLAREALVRDPRAVGAYKILMRVALAQGSPDLAQLLAVKARKLDDSDPEIVAFVGDVLLQRKDEPGAVAQWKKALTLKDDYLPARYALLRNALAKASWEGVSEQARAILRTDPGAAQVHLALGVAYRYLGQPDKALAAYDQAEKAAAGKLPEVHLARGIALMKSKEQCEPALGELKRYLAAAGPASAADGPALRLERECEQIQVASRQAEEAAREMKAEADREAAKKKGAPAGTPSGGGTPPGPASPSAAPPVPVAASPQGAPARQAGRAGGPSPGAPASPVASGSDGTASFTPPDATPE